jgi:hypothetical protein
MYDCANVKGGFVVSGFSGCFGRISCNLVGCSFGAEMRL